MKTLMTAVMIMNATLLYAGDPQRSYPIVDTGQIRCYSHSREIVYPKAGKDYFGQDAQYDGLQPSYKNNGNGTVTDLNTGLMWTQDPGTKKTYGQAVAGAGTCMVGGYHDWRLPTIKELYSLILFSGTDPDPMSSNSTGQRPFIDNRVFKFEYGKAADCDRIIDSQFATTTLYRSTTMNGNKTMFGVNFADGRIKGYPIGQNAHGPERREKTFYVLYVRGNTDYGRNQFIDNSDGTVTDKATGLTWMQVDSGHFKVGINGTLNWEQALQWAEGLDYAGHSDWRLPNAKELQSIVDYTRCPDVTDSAAIDPVFKTTSIINQGGAKDYAYYWTSTSHVGSHGAPGVYIAFGRALGMMRDPRTGQRTLMDVHGAGAQRSDDKSGSASRYPLSRGPQGDIVRVYNLVRCVRGGTAQPRTVGPKVEISTMSRRPGMANGQMNQRTGSQMGQGIQGRGMGRMNQGASAQDFIRRLDRDGDNRVSKEEFDGPAEHFQDFDQNGDGYISSTEAPAGPPLRQ